MTTINYNEFLFYNLTQVCDTIHPLKDLSYDLAFPIIDKSYKEFENSKYNTELYSLYDCITNFLEWY